MFCPECLVECEEYEDFEECPECGSLFEIGTDDDPEEYEPNY